VRIDLLHIEECPSWQVTTRILRSAPDSTDHSETPINVTLIDSADAAEHMAFAGSPTILVDGTDLFPSDSRSQALACRVYVTPNGLAGHPTEDQITEALAAHG
jgi:hypothetical protein